MDRLFLLKTLNELLVEMEEKTRNVEQDKSRQVKLYDSLTKQVNDAVKVYKETKKEPNMKGWLKVQKDIFHIYKSLI